LHVQAARQVHDGHDQEDEDEGGDPSGGDVVGLGHGVGVVGDQPEERHEHVTIIPHEDGLSDPG
jgi:hypothetical protein